MSGPGWSGRCRWLCWLPRRLLLLAVEMHGSRQGMDFALAVVDVDRESGLAQQVGQQRHALAGMHLQAQAMQDVR